MTGSPVNIAKNTTYLTAAYIIQKIFSFLYFILIARLLGVADIGKYVFALSFTTMFGVIIDLGLSPVITREGAKDPDKAADHLRVILGAKMILSAVVYLLVLIAVSLTGKEPLVKELVYISGLIMVLDSFSLTFYAVFRARQTLRYEALGIIIGQVIIFTCGAVALLTHQSLHFLIGAILAGSLWQFTYSLTLLKRKFGFHFRWQFNWAKIWPLLKIALPFAIAAIFARVYSMIDTVLLSTLAGDKAVGWYSAGYKITFALQFIPMAFAAAIFPAMSNYFVTSKELLAKTFEKSMYYLMIIAFPIACGVGALAYQLIGGIYGVAYAPTAMALQILITSLVFNFLGFPVGSLLNSCNRQITNTINLGLTMVVNIILNLILIPYFGAQAYIGAAIAALISSIFLFSIGYYWVGKIVAYNHRFMRWNLAKVLTASIAMSLVLVLLRQTIHFVFLIPVGAVVYLGTLWLVRGINKQEISEFYRSFSKKPAVIEEL